MEYGSTILPSLPALQHPHRNPCDEDFKFYVGFMDVATNSTDCPQTWVETDGFNGTV